MAAKNSSDVQYYSLKAPSEGEKKIRKAKRAVRGGEALHLSIPKLAFSKIYKCPPYVTFRHNGRRLYLMENLKWAFCSNEHFDLTNYQWIEEIRLKQKRRDIPVMTFWKVILIFWNARLHQCVIMSFIVTNNANEHYPPFFLLSLNHHHHI